MEDIDERRNSLAGVPLLAGLAEDIDRGTTPLEAGPWAELAASAQPVSVRAREWLFRQGDPGDSLYVVLTGRLEIVIETEGAAEPKVIRVLGRGDSVGELALLTESPRSASVRARRDSELLLVTREHFARVLERKPEFATALTRVLGRQLRDVKHAGLEPDPVPTTVTVVGLSENLPVRDIGSYLALLLSQYQAVLGVDDQRAAGVTDGADPNAAYAQLLDRAERDHGQVVLMAPVPDVADPWSAFAVRAADRLIGVCRGAEQPPPGIGEIRRLQGCDLVMTSDGREPDGRRARGRRAASTHGSTRSRRARSASCPSRAATPPASSRSRGGSRAGRRASSSRAAVPGRSRTSVCSRR